MKAPGRPLIMGVLNLTPDSFSDGGRFNTPRAALERALEMVDEGADWLDVGGESTRPGAEPISAAEELARILPVIRAIRAESPAPISIDTFKPDVARAAIAAGATLWNDVTALRGGAGSLSAAADLAVPVVLMHMQGEPRTMQQAPQYEDVVVEVSAFLLERAEAAMAAGVARSAIWLDPGLGFGKTVAHNLALLGALDRLVALGFPLLVGASRKGFLRALDPAAADPARRLGGSLAVALAAGRAGAAMVRVHDVRETVQALAVDAAIAAAGAHAA
jgi:dihydropteroate synthase